ncbi:MAG TPA: hypothetical protein VGA87_09410 [Pyrinomonadaceae bacterium]|jgi:hypothetical protein
MLLPAFLGSKHFVIGYGVAVTLFVGGNFYDYHQTDWEGCYDCIISFGFPFDWYRHGGFVTITRISVAGLLANLLLAHAAGIALGLWLKSIERAKRIP